MMFYLPDENGQATGPHTVGTLRKRLNAGEMTWETPVCVHGTEDWVPASVYEDTLEEKESVRERLVCCHCGAPEVQRVKSIYEGGTTHSVSRGQFVGSAGDLSDGDGFDGVVIGVNERRTTSSTVLAARCAPPAQKDYEVKSPGAALALFSCGAILGVVAAVVVKLTGNGVIGLVLGILALVAVVMSFCCGPSEKVKKRADSYFRRAMNDWERRYYCHRCGQMGEPVKTKS